MPKLQAGPQGVKAPRGYRRSAQSPICLTDSPGASKGRRLQAICAKSYMPHRHSGSHPGVSGSFGELGGGVLRKKGEIWAYW